jgi:hypothetical protein
LGITDVDLENKRRNLKLGGGLNEWCHTKEKWISTKGFRVSDEYPWFIIKI